MICADCSQSNKENALLRCMCRSVYSYHESNQTILMSVPVLPVRLDEQLYSICDTFLGGKTIYFNFE